MNHPILSSIGRSATWISAWAAVSLAPVLAIAAPAHDAAHGGHGGHEAAHDNGIVWVSDIFGNEGKTGLLFTLINFGLLLYLLDKLLFSKLRASTRAKHETVKSELARATEAHQEAKSMVEDYRTKLDGLAKESEALMAEAKERAESDRKRIIDAANREAEQIRTSAIAAAERDAESHRRRLEAEVVDRAVERAEKLIRERIGAPDQARMVDAYVGHIATVDFSGAGKAKAAPTTEGGAS